MDGRVYDDNHVKLFKDIGEYKAVVGAGDAQEIMDTLDMLREVPFEIFRTLEAEDPKEPIFKGSTILAVVDGRESEELWLLQGAKSILMDKQWAFGSGGEFALAAMDLGQTAQQAVKFASKRDLFTGGKIQSYKLKGA